MAGRARRSAGLRIDYETTEAEASGGVTLSGSDSFSGLSPKLAVGYQVSDGLRVYALYSSGFRAGGFTRVVAPQNVAFSFSPQRSHNFEIGTHARFFEADGSAGRVRSPAIVGDVTCP